MAVYTGPLEMARIIADRAEQLADVVAIETIDRSTTYGDLAVAAEHVHGGLGGLGVKPGDRVATMLDPSLDALSAWFGTAYAGAIEVPVNTAYKGMFLETVLNETAAEVLVIEADWLALLEGLDLPHLRHVVARGEGQAPTGDPCWPISSYAELLQSPAIGPVLVDENETLWIVYTSGTTGPSKGVTHSSVSGLTVARGAVNVLELDPTDVAYTFFPTFHITARTFLLSAQFLVGGRIVMRDRFSGTAYWDDIRRGSVTWSAGMGSILGMLLAQPPQPNDAENVLKFIGASAHATRNG